MVTRHHKRSAEIVSVSLLLLADGLWVRVLPAETRLTKAAGVKTPSAFSPFSLPSCRCEIKPARKRRMNLSILPLAFKTSNRLLIRIWHPDLEFGDIN